MAATPELPSQMKIRSPIKLACISSPFGPRVLPNKTKAGIFHHGIDIPAPLGTRITAVATGMVIRIQRRGLGGLEVLIQHDGFIGVYSHLGRIAPALAEGRKTIDAGQWIATVGRTGLTYGPHLYFGMIVAGRSIDPAPYLQIEPCQSAKSPSRNMGSLTSPPLR